MNIIFVDRRIRHGVFPSSSLTMAPVQVTVAPALLRRLDPLMSGYALQLLTAVQNQDTLTVKRLLAKHTVPPNLRIENPPDGWYTPPLSLLSFVLYIVVRTTLMYASICGNTDLFRFILDKGHDDETRSKDHDNCTVLHITAEYGYTKEFKIYLEKYPDTLGMLDMRGRSALHAAAQFGRDDVVEVSVCPFMFYIYLWLVLDRCC